MSTEADVRPDTCKDCGLGSMPKRDVERFAASALKHEGYEGWKMEWSCDPGWCSYKSKIIYIPDRIKGQRPWTAKEYVLHEMAHIRGGEYHGPFFYDEYIRLLRRYFVDEVLEKEEREAKING